ncbi:helix-turn-helix transcriptional regulator [Agathobaculum desmolans]|uniref:helix-turn-helix transcriptional regulator n=1 Tax=Agathobaculum desmolans TaxID=39484 RepID=UPI0004E194C7|nr:LuxR C-terminal-related transcriptional regulator [Agathobaculum desmolans]
MNLKTEFTEPECEWFRAVCNFTPDERKVFDLRVKDHSIIEISMKLQMSESTVSRRIKNIKRKIVKVL